jgi:uncharacterized Zn-finger protein
MAKNCTESVGTAEVICDTAGNGEYTGLVSSKYPVRLCRKLVNYSELPDFDQRTLPRKRCQKSKSYKPFRCNQCDYSAVRRDYVKSHMARHTGEKLHKCNICDFSSGWKHSLVNHLKCHARSDIEDRLYIYNQCYFPPIGHRRWPII